MEIFGISFENMLLILFIALIIFGPERLPQIAGQIGRWIGEFRRMSTEVRSEVSRELSLSEFQKLKSEVTDIASETRKEITDLKSEMAGIATETRKELTELTSEVKSTVAYEQSFYNVEDNTKTGSINDSIEASVNGSPATALASVGAVDPTATVDLDISAAMMSAAATHAQTPKVNWRSALGRPVAISEVGSGSDEARTEFYPTTSNFSTTTTMPNYDYTQDYYFGRKLDVNSNGNGSNGAGHEAEAVEESEVRSQKSEVSKE